MLMQEGKTSPLFLRVVLLVAAAAGIYYLALPKTPTEETFAPPPAPLVEEDVTEKIAAEVNAGTYENLALAMTNPVTVIVYASECCGERSPAQAVIDMQYLSDEVPYNFDQRQETIAILMAADPGHFAGTFVGLSETGDKGVAFTVGDDNLIHTIFIFPSSDLFTGQ
jgi:hypothetical protein